MGTVDIDFSDGCNLEEFIFQWEHKFFNSYFSHTVRGHMPTKSNIVQLWQGQVGRHKKFPENILVKTNLTLKDLLI